MIEIRRKLLRDAMKLFDLGATIAALAIATTVTSGPHHVSLKRLLSVQVTCSHVLLYGLVLLIWPGLYGICGLYESKRLTSHPQRAKELLLATGLVVISLPLAQLAASIPPVKATFVVVFWCVAAVILLWSRLIVYCLLGAVRRRGSNHRHLLILGTNRRAREFAAWIRSKPELGYRLVGFVDADWPGMPEPEKSGCPICCDVPGLEEFLRWQAVDEIAMYLPLRSFYEHAARVASLCEQHGITLRLDLDLFNLKGAHARSDESVDESQIATVTSTPAQALRPVKRILDFAVSLVLLVVLLPLLALLAVAVKATSEGPVLFRQKRVGLNRRQFTMYKFRTMVAGAEDLQDRYASLNEMSGPVFKIKNDPRVTQLGRILRRTSLDELPQLWNVLRGEMSLVGPRAMSVRDYGQFPQDWQRRRFSVKPGITCLWQVNGRSSLTFSTWMEMDMEYIDHWSFWLDVRILARTIPAVIKGVGAA